MSIDEDTKHDRPSLRDMNPYPEFGPRYRVIESLGKGGMGEVYRAYDTELKGEVALKIVRGDADLDAALARFRREIALARKVTSPNVLRVYDIAEYDGLRFLSMELVDGEDLAALMKREKQLSIDRAVAIFKQVCAGLAAAHAQGVVHRDLKPQNVLVDKNGTVRVADFGLARSMTDSSLTASGAILGSPAYMSPEQVKGDPTDERSDIYSLGVMLYQLVTSETPFRADTPHAVMEMRLHKKPKLLREVRADAPAYLEAIAAKCLALAPAARYASMRDVLAALDQATPATRSRPRWILPALAGGLVVAVGAIAVVAWPRARHEERPAEVATAPSVAAPAAPMGQTTVLVLGFDNRTSEAVLDATLDEILYLALRRSRTLEVISGILLRNLATELGPDVGLDEHLGEKLAARDHVRAITVHGTITPRGAGFDVALVATDNTTHKVVLSRTESAPKLDALVPAVGRLASDLRDVLGDRVPPAEREITGASPSLDADHEYALARSAAHSGDNMTAIEHAQRSVAHDPKFALAHAALAICYSNVGRPADSIAENQRVLAAIDTVGEHDRLKLIGDYYFTVTEEFERSKAAYEELLAKWPRDLAGQLNLALVYQATGEIDKALELGRRSAKQFPRDSIARGNFGVYEILAGQYEEALHDLRQVIEDLPRPQENTNLYIGLTELFLGKRDEALAAYGRYAEVDPSGGAATQADLAIAEGRLAEAEKLLVGGIAKDTTNGLVDNAEVKQEMLAEVRLARGDKAGARTAAALVVKQPPRVLLAAIVLADAGDPKRATAIANRFATDVAPSHRAIAKLVEGELLREEGKTKQAIVAFQDGLHLSEIPFGHLLLARAALDAKLYAEAYSELRASRQRLARLAIPTTDDILTYRYVPQVTYYLAKAQDGLGSAEAAASYKAFLDMMHDPDPADPLVADARKHL